MKKYLILVIILFLTSINILLCDNWEPFPYNKTLLYTHSPYIDSYYSYSGIEFGKDEYFDVRFDSMYVDGNSKTYYSDRYRRYKQLPCINDTFDFTYSLRNYDVGSYSSPYYFQEDFYTIRNDTAIFHINFDEYHIFGQLYKLGRYDALFPLNMMIGDTFAQEFQDSNNFRTVKIYCDTIIEENVFEQSDSIKIFEFYRGVKIGSSIKIYDTLYLKLSKSFGFIDFVPFFYIYPKSFSKWWPEQFNPRITLVGIKDTLQSLGIQMPESVTADELLTLNVGDVIKWQNTRCPDKSYNRLDSVMSIKRTNDSIFITYFEILYDTLSTYRPEGGHKFSSIKNKKYSIKDYLDLFNGPTNEVLFTNLGEKNTVAHRLFKKNAIYCNRDTFTQVSIGENGVRADTSDCWSTWLTDTGGIYTYNPKFGRSGWSGEIFHCKVILDWGQGPKEVIMNQYADEVVIVGYRIGGKVCGDLSMPDTTLGVKEVVENIETILYPNPARDYIYINSPLIEGVGGGWQYQIYDILGNCVQSGILDANKINISQLSSGFYTVRFFNGGKQVVEKMMKE